MNVPKISDHEEITSPCIISPFYKNKKGYAIKNGRVHSRQVFEETYGKLNMQDKVCHRCDNPGCINIGHLAIGSNHDNQQDSLKKNRRAVRQGENNGRAKLSLKDVQTIKERLKKSHRGICRQLAEEFNTSPSTISHIRNAYTWSI